MAYSQVLILAVALAAAPPSTHITLNAEGQPLGQLLRGLNAVAPVDLMFIDPSISDRPVTVSLKDVPVVEAFRRALEASGLPYVMWGRDAASIRVFVAADDSALQRATAAHAEGWLGSLPAATADAGPAFKPSDRDSGADPEPPPVDAAQGAAQGAGFEAFRAALYPDPNAPRGSDQVGAGEPGFEQLRAHLYRAPAPARAIDPSAFPDPGSRAFAESVNRSVKPRPQPRPQP